MSSSIHTVGQIEQRLNALFHIELAESWDNVGLLVGDRHRPVERIMLCIDLAEPVLREAQSRRVDFVLAYHPPIFEPLRSVLADRQSIVYRAVKADIAVYSVHTALDVIPGGTSDALADLLELQDRRPIRPIGRSDQSKLVVFVPEEHADRVASAIFAAGGGVIGDYTHCSFRAAGCGTFFGGEQAHPSVGQAGKFEVIPELRLEVRVDSSRLSEVVRQMKQAHPYEEVAFDVYPLSPIDGDLGLGRIGTLVKPGKLKSVVTAIKRRTGQKNVLVVPGAAAKVIRKAAVGPGSCGKLCHEIAGRVDLYLTGELRHHDALMLQASGTHVICLGHGNSERPVLKNLGRMIKTAFPEMGIFTSARDSDPLQIA